MAANTAGAAALTVLIVGASSGVYAQFGPSMFTISSDFFNENGSVEGNRRRIRHAEILGSIITISMGWAGSVLTKSPIPLIGAAAYAAISCGAWEYSMAHPASTD